ncbi:hypothetical protein CIW83_04870 [Tissierella sp. P1]|uniref:hypothetical protein n=1 Tax=Tissierella carlieri TaxID=689904 RepID=UPI000BA03E10|nr:hypothetical protein CIW83_04870 [Tissierella sp. P1]
MSKSALAEMVSSIRRAKAHGSTNRINSLSSENKIDLSQEEIFKLLGMISREIKKDKNYEINLDSIIENPFREFGIYNFSNLDAAKSKLRITISDYK